jgi:phage portal protein BeeE
LGINKKSESVQAQYAPAIMDTAYGYGSFTTGVGNFPGGLDRNFAMQVPAVSRCRNLIAGVVSYLPLKLYKKSNGEELGNPLWIDQPDYRHPGLSIVCCFMVLLIGVLQNYMQMI